MSKTKIFDIYGQILQKGEKPNLNLDREFAKNHSTGSDNSEFILVIIESQKQLEDTG